MEAVPRLPMLHFPRKESTEKSSFNGLKQYIAECYGENPDSFSKEIYELETLRNKAVRPSEDLIGLAVIKRYICQIHSIGNRFPLGDENPVLSFSWREIHAPTVWQSSSLRYEIAVLLYNVAGLHTQLGAEESRTNSESMKVACTHFQCAGWIYGYIRDNYPASMRHEMSGELLVYMQNIAFAQAQECIMEKSLVDNRKAITIAKVTAQIVSYYNSAMAVLLSTVDGESISDVVGNKTLKAWKRYVKFKISYLTAILLLYQGQQSEDAQKMGERVTYYQAANEKIEEAKKESKGMDNIDAINDTLTFTMDVIEAKRKTGKNENDFIYHEEIPELKNLSAVQPANLVNGISFSFTDPEVAGEDIFHRLVPMKAHESSSIYSEEKANLLRSVAAKVEDKDSELTAVMSSINLDSFGFNTSSLHQDKLPQSLVDRCASLSAKPNAIPDLVSSMSSLSEIWVEVEAMLNEIKNQLSEEEEREHYYQKSMGQRPPGGHMQELAREFQKYLEAHSKAGESNDTLRKAMGLHVSNLKILSLTLPEISRSVPILQGDLDESALQDIQLLLNKVEEMKIQRQTLLSMLREALNNDDITSQVIAWGDKKIEKLFKKELGKHDKTLQLLEQNMAAQANILKALTDTYAKCSTLIKAINETKVKRDQFFTALTASYDVYEDLLGKSTKGLEFYKKLHGNVQKLLSRVKGARDVQDEERQQRLQAKTKQQTPLVHPTVPTNINTRSGPKLKDYLNNGFSVSNKHIDTATYIPPIRPSPLGSESVSDQKCNLPGTISGGQMHGMDLSKGYRKDHQQQNFMPSVGNYDPNYASYSTGYYQKPMDGVAMNPNMSMQYGYSNTNQVPDASKYQYPVVSQTNTVSVGYTNPIYQPPYYGSDMSSNLTQYQMTQTGSSSTTSIMPKSTIGSTTQSYSTPQMSQSMGNNSYNMSSSSVPVSTPSYAGTSMNQMPNTGVTGMTQQMGQMNLNQGFQGYQYGTPQGSNQNNYSYQQPNSTSMSSNSTSGNTPSYTNSYSYTAPPVAPIYSNQMSSYTMSYPTYPSYGASCVSQAGSNVQDSDAHGRLFDDVIRATPVVPEPVTDVSTTNNYQNIGNNNATSYQYSSPPPQSQSSTNPTTTTSTTSSTSYALTSHPTNPMYMGVEGVLKESGGQLPVSSPKTNINNSSQSTGYVFNQATGAWELNNIRNSSSNEPSYIYNQMTGSWEMVNNGTGQGQAGTNTQMQEQYPVDSTYSNSGQYSAPSQPNLQQGGTNTQSTQSSMGLSMSISEQTGQQQSFNQVQQPLTPASVQPTLQSPAAIPTTQPQTQTPTVPLQPVLTPIKSANLDLLSDIDFSMTSSPMPATLPLQPQQAKRDDDQKSQVSSNQQTIRNSPAKIPIETIPQSPSLASLTSQLAINPPPSTPIDRKSSVDNLSICSDVSSIDPNFDWESASLRNDDSISGIVPTKISSEDIVGKYKDAFDDPKVLKWFHKEVERLEKFIETSTIKTLNGTTSLDGKWKELQDLLVKDESKRCSNVARLFPEKNRSIDSIPYDHARVSLATSTDDYINAGYIKDLGGGFPTFIIAQTPMPNTVNDFWAMIWSQNVNTVVCLHPPAEILDVYWPQELNTTTTLGDFEVTLMKQFDLSHCVERSVKVATHGQDKLLYVSILQIKGWIKNSANHILGIGQNIITSYEQQNQDKKNLSRLVIHCLNGSERSGLVTLAVACILATQTKRPILTNVVDVWYRICSQRKGGLRDINTLQLSLQIVLNNGHNILNKRGIMTSYQMKNVQQQAAVEKEETAMNDPFKDLDPLWKLKK